MLSCLFGYQVVSHGAQNTSSDVSCRVVRICWYLFCFCWVRDRSMLRASIVVCCRFEGAYGQLNVTSMARFWLMSRQYFTRIEQNRNKEGTPGYCTVGYSNICTYRVGKSVARCVARCDYCSPNAAYVEVNHAEVSFQSPTTPKPLGIQRSRKTERGRDIAHRRCAS